MICVCACPIKLSIHDWNRIYAISSAFFLSIPLYPPLSLFAEYVLYYTISWELHAIKPHNCVSKWIEQRCNNNKNNWQSIEMGGASKTAAIHHNRMEKRDKWIDFKCDIVCVWQYIFISYSISIADCWKNNSTVLNRQPLLLPRLTNTHLQIDMLTHRHTRISLYLLNLLVYWLCLVVLKPCLCTNELFVLQLQIKVCKWRQQKNRTDQILRIFGSWIECTTGALGCIGYQNRFKHHSCI